MTLTLILSDLGSYSPEGASSTSDCVCTVLVAWPWGRNWHLLI